MKSHKLHRDSKNKIFLHLKKKIDNSYPIRIEPGILEKIPEYIQKMELKGKFIIVTDSNVLPLYGQKLYQKLIDAGFTGDITSFEAGEKNKTRQTKRQIEDYMLEKSFGRDSFVIAVGGGVTGDIAGFVAATYNRGIPFIQVPTTLLSMVDSSVGGKTGVDTEYGKNLIGAFYQPKAVFIDPETLRTLEKREIINGLAEIIKHTIIRDKELFDSLVSNKEQIFELNMDTLTEMIRSNVRIKADIVEEDETESNLRRVLNFGHTIGHAVELLTNYSLGHGECVAIGMAVEAEISKELNILPDEDYRKIINCIKMFNLPTEIPKELDPNKIIHATCLDKKAKNGKALYTFPALIGAMYDIDEDFGIFVDDKLVMKAIKNRY